MQGAIQARHESARPRSAFPTLDRPKMHGAINIIWDGHPVRPNVLTFAMTVAAAADRPACLRIRPRQLRSGR